MSAALIASLPELGRMDRRQIASLSGLAPHVRESGAFKRQTPNLGRPRRCPPHALQPDDIFMSLGSGCFSFVLRACYANFEAKICFRALYLAAFIASRHDPTRP